MTASPPPTKEHKMSEYRKKPVVIEAFRWTGGPDQTEDPQWCVDAILAGTVRFENSGTPDVAMLIDTLEGTHRANQGDFIIKGVKGELYPCKPDIFALTYEPASTPVAETATIEGLRGEVERLKDALEAVAGFDTLISHDWNTRWSQWSHLKTSENVARAALNP